MAAGVADGEGFGWELREWAEGVIEDLQGLGAGIGDGGNDLEVFDIGNSVRAYGWLSSTFSNIGWLVTSNFQRESWSC
jgi:hypothetical protein